MVQHRAKHIEVATAEMLSCAVRKNDQGCWLWTGSIGENGYGFVRVKVGVTTRAYAIHRLSYQHYKGKIPYGLCIRHTCDNRRCFNPKHLLLGSHFENMRDMVDRGRAGWQKPGRKTKASKERRREMTEEAKGQKAYEALHEGLYQKRYSNPHRNYHAGAGK